MIPIIRSVLGIQLGYTLFAGAAFAFFQLTGTPPHAEATFGVMAASTAVGIVGAFLGGYLAGVIAGRRPRLHASIMAAVLALGASASMLMTIGHGAIWSQLSALLFMAPSAVGGGWVRERKRTPAREPFP